jgi:hypothetical protein
VDFLFFIDLVKQSNSRLNTVVHIIRLSKLQNVEYLERTCFFSSGWSGSFLLHTTYNQLNHQN